MRTDLLYSCIIFYRNMISYVKLPGVDHLKFTLQYSQLNYSNQKESK